MKKNRNAVRYHEPKVLSPRSGKDTHEGLFVLFLYCIGLLCFFKSLNLIECQICLNPKLWYSQENVGQKGLLRTTLKSVAESSWRGIHSAPKPMLPSAPHDKQSCKKENNREADQCWILGPVLWSLTRWIWRAFYRSVTKIKMKAQYEWVESSCRLKSF